MKRKGSDIKRNNENAKAKWKEEAKQEKIDLEADLYRIFKKHGEPKDDEYYDNNVIYGGWT